MNPFPGAPPKPERRGPKKQKPIARRKRHARVRQTARGRDKQSLKELFSRVIRGRDPQCVIGRCGISSRQRPTAYFRRSEHACHLLPKGAYPSIEFRDENAVGGCAPCHRYMTDHPTEWLGWVIAHLGHDRYVALVELSRKVKPETRAEIRTRLEAML